MKRLIVILVISVASLPVVAQDLIITTNNDTIYCKIIKVGDASIEYQVSAGGVVEQIMMPIGYVAEYRITEQHQNFVQPANIVWSTPQYSKFRWGLGLGYAYRMGKDPEPSGSWSFDELHKGIRNGFSWETELQYYFNQSNGIALHVSGVHCSVSGENIQIPTLGRASTVQIKHRIVFVAPGWTFRHGFNSNNFNIFGTVALGPVFYAESLIPDNITIQATAVSVGLSTGFGGEFVLSPNFAMGMKMGLTQGSTSKFKLPNGQTLEMDDPVSLSSFIFSVYFSFRSK